MVWGGRGYRSRTSLLTILVSLALFGWWLWGSSAWHHVQAVSAQLRDMVAGAEPVETRVRVAGVQIDQARGEAKRLAEVIGGFEIRIEALDRKIDQARQKQNADRSLLAEFQRRLRDASDGRTIRINGRQFDYGDVENEASGCLDRFNARTRRLADLDNLRRKLVKQKTDMQMALRDYMKRVRDLDRNQDRIRDLRQQQQFVKWADSSSAWRGNGKALRRAESTQQKILLELDGMRRAHRIIDEQINGRAAPMADELQRELNPQTPLIDRIRLAIGE